MRFTLNYGHFATSLNVMVNKVEAGSREALKEVCRNIEKETMLQVPRDTDTLANSFGWNVYGRGRYINALIGYSLRGDPVNPKTGRKASSYMLPVHEDLSAIHPIGKAKFFEDPYRKYGPELTAIAASAIRGRLK